MPSPPVWVQSYGQKGLCFSELLALLLQVVEPAVKCFMYTWGKGRTTAEGEHIPVRIEQMEIHHIDGMLVLTPPPPSVPPTIPLRILEIHHVDFDAGTH
jgi:hypothetical protein